MTNEELKKYDFILVLDKSGSMGEKDMPGGQSRWQAAREATVALARKCTEYDQDGITVVPFATSFKVYHNITGGDEEVDRIFKENDPMGSTDTAGVLKHVLDEYLASRQKPIIVLCVTDGQPNPPQEAVANVIIEATKKMETDGEIGISFIQIGKDPGATAFLKDLDDGLVAKGAKFDIVDTKTADEIENMPIADVLIQALTD